MDLNTCKALIDAAEAGIASQGFNLYDGARLLRCRATDWLKFLDAAHSRESLEAFLREDDADEEKVQHLVGLLTAAPILLQTFVSDAVRSSIASLPSKQRGPSSKLLSKDKSEITELIGRLIVQGVSIGDAQVRAGKRFGISKRQVQRVWRARKNVSETPTYTLDDVWQVFQHSSPERVDGELLTQLTCNFICSINNHDLCTLVRSNNMAKTGLGNSTATSNALYSNTLHILALCAFNSGKRLGDIDLPCMRNI